MAARAKEADAAMHVLTGCRRLSSGRDGASCADSGGACAGGSAIKSMDEMGGSSASQRIEGYAASAGASRGARKPGARLAKLRGTAYRMAYDLLAKLGVRGHAVNYIGGGMSLPAPFTLKEEKEQLEKLRLGDTQVRQALIEHNLRLVVYIARKFENTGVGLEDLISIGTIGLIKAVNTFDPSKNIKLATYGSRCIENEILMYLRRNSRLRLEVSFDEPLNTDWDGNELLLSDILGTEADLVSRDIESDTEREMLRQALSTLNAREQRIMALRYGLGGQPEMTQREVAELLGISQSYISRLEKRIIAHLRGEMAKLQ